MNQIKWNIVAKRKHRCSSRFNDDNEKPQISAKSSHWKTVRSSPEGGKVNALRAAKTKKKKKKKKKKQE
ncbi:hypothetical protein MTR_4g061040 [Medicago truncatula]|uniref:Uncharacterized protein n=1 Tax=Medicago truncatula TaxID=3880 RepID=G7JRH5_MEDTR|nr:hypothetical protein MTR_4g061040 [Medicago truncatula]